MTEYFESTIECVEAPVKSVVADAATDVQPLEVRRKCIGEWRGVGPPDLCYLTKARDSPAFLRPLGLGGAGAVGYFHWVSGADTSSAEAIAAYVKSVLASQLPATMLQRVQGPWQYNAFRKQDVNVKMSETGDVQETWVNTADGERVDGPFEPQFWTEVFLCSQLRSIAAEVEAPDLPAHRVKPLHDSADREQRTFVAGAELFGQGSALGCDRKFAPISEAGTHRLATLLHEYLASMARFERIIEFFEPLVESTPSVAAFVGGALLELDRVDDCLSLLSRALAASPESVALVTVHARALVADKRDDEALTLLRNASFIHPNVYELYLEQARIHARRRALHDVLLTLNGVPKEAMEEDEPPYKSHQAKRLGVPFYSRITEPPQGAWSAHMAQRCEDAEFTRMPSDEELYHLSAPGLLRFQRMAYDVVASAGAEVGFVELRNAYRQLFAPQRDQDGRGSTASVGGDEVAAADGDVDTKGEAESERANTEADGAGAEKGEDEGDEQEQAAAEKSEGGKEEDDTEDKTETGEEKSGEEEGAGDGKEEATKPDVDEASAAESDAADEPKSDVAAAAGGAEAAVAATPAASSMTPPQYACKRWLALVMYALEQDFDVWRKWKDALKASQSGGMLEWTAATGSLASEALGWEPQNHANMLRLGKAFLRLRQKVDGVVMLRRCVEFGWLSEGWADMLDVAVEMDNTGMALEAANHLACYYTDKYALKWGTVRLQRGLFRLVQRHGVGTLRAEARQVVDESELAEHEREGKGVFGLLDLAKRYGLNPGAADDVAIDATVDGDGADGTVASAEAAADGSGSASTDDSGVAVTGNGQGAANEAAAASAATSDAGRESADGSEEGGGGEEDTAESV